MIIGLNGKEQEIALPFDRKTFNEHRDVKQLYNYCRHDYPLKLVVNGKTIRITNGQPGKSFEESRIIRDGKVIISNLTSERGFSNAVGFPKSAFGKFL